MKAPPTTEALQRADEPSAGDGAEGLLRAGEGERPNWTPAFVVLLAYLFLSASAVDEHFGAIGALRPRLVLGLLVLMFGVLTGLREKLATGAGLALRHSQSRWLTAFIIAGAFSMLWAFRMGDAKDSFTAHLLAVLSFMLILTLVRTRRELVITLLTVCAGSGLYISLSVWEWLHGRHDFTMGVVRMQGAGSMYQDPNSFGATIVFMLPIFVWVGLNTRSNLIRASVLLYGLLTTYCAFKTSSRSALVLFAIVGVWTIMALPRARQKLGALLLVGFASAVLIANLSPSQIKRIESIGSANTYEREGSTRGRIEGYQVGFEIFKDRPVLGVGPGNWSAYRSRKIDGRMLLGHNLAGSLLAERGLAGALTFVGFLFAALLLGWRSLRRWHRSQDAWERAVALLCSAGLCTYVLLLVSGLGAHNLDRPNWYSTAALMLVAVGTLKTSRSGSPA